MCFPLIPALREKNFRRKVSIRLGRMQAHLQRREYRNRRRGTNEDNACELRRGRLYSTCSSTRGRGDPCHLRRTQHNQISRTSAGASFIYKTTARPCQASTNANRCLKHLLPMPRQFVRLFESEKKHTSIQGWMQRLRHRPTKPHLAKDPAPR